MKPARLADNVGVSKGYVSGLLSGGKKNPSIELCVKFSKVLECSPIWLFDGSEENEVKNAESSVNLKEPGVGESACRVCEEPAIYGAGIAEMGSLGKVSREEEIVLAFRQIRAGLDLLEQIMKKGNHQ